MNTSTIPFGKYRGESVASVAKKNPHYLEWMLNDTDVADNHPALATAITDAIDKIKAHLPELSDITLVEVYAPHLYYDVRGGGSMHEGVSEIVQLVKGDSPLSPERKYLDSEKLGTGRSGRVNWILGDDPVQILRVVETSGSIVNQKRDVSYYKVTRDTAEDRWEHIEQGELAAYVLCHNLP